MIKRLSVMMVLTILLTLVLTGCTSNSKVEKLEQDYVNQIKGLNDEIETLNQSNENMSKLIGDLNETVEGYSNTLIDLEKDIKSKESELDQLQTLVDEQAELLSMTNETPSLVVISQTIIELIRDEDFVTLSGHIHPSKGVRLTPYPYIDLSNDIVLTAAEVATISTSATSYLWGQYDGSGDPINATPMAYYNEFIYDEDYASPHLVGHNTIIGTGNMINNINSEYPSADFVEYHFTGFNPSYSGMDWSSLTLVYEQVGPTWYLVGIIHGQWTS